MPRIYAQRPGELPTVAPNPRKHLVSGPPASSGRKAQHAGGALADLPRHDGKAREKANVTASKPKAPPAVEGYLYAPFVGDGTASSVAGEAMRRIAKGAAPYPVIVANEADAKALRAQVETLRSEIARMVETVQSEIARMAESASKPSKRPSDFNPKRTGKAVEKTRLRLRALDSLQVLDAQATGVLAKLQPDRSKLYIGGHGAPGMNGVVNKLGDGSKVFVSAQMLSAQLKAAGLPADFEDIRAKACWSADRRRLDSFSPAERKDASTPDPSEKPRRQAPLGVHLLNALHADGFTQASVTGYHGLSQHLPDNFDKQFHAAQALDDGPPKRRSTVKERFTTPVALTGPETGDR